MKKDKTTPKVVEPDDQTRTAVQNKIIKKLKRRLRLVLFLFAIFLTATAIYIYLNYDYLAFKHFITGHYIYTDTLDELYKNELKENAEQGRFYRDFDNVAISIITREIRKLNNDRYTYLYLPEQYIQHQQTEKTDAEKSKVIELTKDTVYLYFNNFTKYSLDFIKENTQKLKQYKNLVIDLQNNYGGDISVMVDISSMFLPKGDIIAVDDMRIWDTTYKSKGTKTFDFEKIVILQSKNSASSAENLIAALKDNLDNILLIGETTFGKGIGQFTLPLRRGFAVKATILLWNTPNGINIQGNGIPPDIQYTGEDIIDEAMRQITSPE